MSPGPSPELAFCKLFPSLATFGTFTAGQFGHTSPATREQFAGSHARTRAELNCQLIRAMQSWLID